MNKDYVRFGPEIRRVRAGERALDDGGKKVWHQAAEGIELISFVDPQGHVTRQELHLEGAVTVWQHGATPPVCTASTLFDRNRSSPGLVRDGQLIVRTVELALNMMRAVPGGDRYLDHFRGELEAAAAGMPELDDDTVTGIERKRPSAVELDAPVTARRNTLLLGVGAALLVAAAIAGWLFTR